MTLLLPIIALAAPPTCDPTTDVADGTGLCVDPIEHVELVQASDRLTTCEADLQASETREESLTLVLDAQGRWMQSGCEQALQVAAKPRPRVTWEGVAVGAGAVLLSAVAVGAVAGWVERPVGAM